MYMCLCVYVCATVKLLCVHDDTSLVCLQDAPSFSDEIECMYMCLSVYVRAIVTLLCCQDDTYLDSFSSRCFGEGSECVYMCVVHVCVCHCNTSVLSR